MRVRVTKGVEFQTTGPKATVRTPPKDRVGAYLGETSYEVAFDHRAGYNGLVRTGPLRISEGNDPALRLVEPVPRPVGGSSHPDDWRGDVTSGRRPQPLGVTERVHRTCARDEPVAVTVGRHRHADHGVRQVPVGERAVEPDSTASKDASVGADQPITRPAGSGVHRNDRGDHTTRERPEAGSGSVGEDSARSRHLPAAPPRLCRPGPMGAAGQGSGKQDTGDQHSGCCSGTARRRRRSHER